MTLIIFAVLSATVLYIALAKGWMINLWVFITVLASVFVDLACQLWIDISKLFKKRIRLDETENFYHK